MYTCKYEPFKLMEVCFALLAPSSPLLSLPSSVSYLLYFSPISLCHSSIADFFPSLLSSISYMHWQTKVKSIHSSGNLFNTYKYEPQFGIKPRVVPCWARWGITPSVLLWNISRDPWEGGSSGLEYFQVLSLQIRVGFGYYNWNMTKGMSDI